METIKQRLKSLLEAGKAQVKGVRWIRVLTAALAGLALLLVASLFKDCSKQPPVVTTKTYTPAPPLTKRPIPTQKVPVQGGAVKAYDKRKLNDELPAWSRLSEEILADDGAAVTATAELKPSEGGYAVVAVTQTSGEHAGETIIQAKEKERPLFELEAKKEIGARYGVATGAGNPQEIDIYARYSFVRIGNMHVAVYGEAAAHNGVSAKAMIDASLRW